MGEGEPAKEEVPAASADEVVPPPPPLPPAEVTKDVSEEKGVIPTEEKPDDSKALAVVQNQPSAEKLSGSLERDAVLARVETEKRLSLVKAWEENEKSKVENKAEKKLSEINSWENTKKAAAEAELKKMEEHLEKKKADYAEKIKNKVATTHMVSEEKKAMVEAQRGEELLKAEEMAAKYRIKGLVPKKVLGCFGS